MKKKKGTINIKLLSIILCSSCPHYVSPDIDYSDKENFSLDMVGKHWCYKLNKELHPSLFIPDDCPLPDSKEK